MRKLMLAVVVAMLPMMSNATPHTFTERQVECLALNVYYESRGEPVLGQKAVAWVTLNRLDSHQYTNTICDVVYDRNQFSWTKNKVRVKDKGAYHKSHEVATKVIEEYMQDANDPTKGATMFHATHVSPRWRKSFKKTLSVGAHVFYR